MDAMLVATDLWKSYAIGRRARRAPIGEARGGTAAAVRGICLHVNRGEFFSLLGPSGCGKSTTLRMIAGLETPDSGSIYVNGSAFFDAKSRVNLPPNHRNLGMVFQSYAIWPHMSVYANTAFPLQVGPRSRRLGGSKAHELVMSTLEMVGLADKHARSATALSGGQQQRLALARALVSRPHLMLLDEPLSNLDTKLRESMCLELKRLQRDLGLTMIYVTHDQNEALTLSNRIAVMDDGLIRQIDKPRDVYEHPSDRFVATFVGTTNMIQASVSDVGTDRALIDTAAGSLQVKLAVEVGAGERVMVSIRPEHIALAEDDPAEPLRANQWTGVVVTRAYRGDQVGYVIDAHGVELNAFTNPRISLVPGTQVRLSLDIEDLVILPGDDPQPDRQIVADRSTV